MRKWFVAACILLLFTPVFAANVTILQLPQGTAPTGVEPFETIQGGHSAYLTLNQMVGIVNIPLVCDGSTDNHDLIVAAYNTAVAAGGHTVLKFPASSQSCVTSTLSLQTNRTDGVSYQGQGKSSTTLKLVSGSSMCAIFLLRYADNTSVSDMTLDGSNCSANSNPVVVCVQCTNAYVENNTIINFTTLGAALNSVQTGAIRNNDISRPTTTAAESQAISVSSTLSTSTNIDISGNNVQNSIIEVNGKYTTIVRNIVNGSGFGALIAIDVDAANSAYATIVGNNLSNGVGTDVNGVAVLGIENGAPYSTIGSNTINNVAGAGISNFGSHSTISGNTINNCGTVTSGPSQNPYGIISVDDGLGHTGSNSSITGNFVANGAGNGCLYGYGENVAAMTGIEVFANNFEGALTGPFNVNSASVTRIWYYDQTYNRFNDRNAGDVTGTTVVPDAGASNNFLTGITPYGVITKAQPAVGNLSGVGTGVAPALGNGANTTGGFGVYTAPTTYTPTVVPGSGTYTTVTATGTYTAVGKLYCVNVTVTYTDVGTGTTNTNISLPTNVAGSTSLSGDETAVTGITLIAYTGSGNYIAPRSSVTSAPFVPANGAVIVLSGCYISS
jgi:hypothetical protein